MFIAEKWADVANTEFDIAMEKVKSDALKNREGIYQKMEGFLPFTDTYLHPGCTEIKRARNNAKIS